MDESGIMTDTSCSLGIFKLQQLCNPYDAKPLRPSLYHRALP